MKSRGAASLTVSLRGLVQPIVVKDFCTQFETKQRLWDSIQGWSRWLNDNRTIKRQRRSAPSWFCRSDMFSWTCLLRGFSDTRSVCWTKTPRTYVRLSVCLSLPLSRLPLHESAKRHKEPNCSLSSLSLCVSLSLWRLHCLSGSPSPL